MPLLCPQHFSSGGLQWPLAGRKKPNAIARNAATERMLWPRGCYVVLRRLSSKEEKRRWWRTCWRMKHWPRSAWASRNHLNVIHCGQRGCRLRWRAAVVYLNSQAVDDYFRTFSGQTQVNATDLRHLRYSSRAAL